MMTEHTLYRAKIRQLYRTSCHGAGADVRWKARFELEDHFGSSGMTVSEFFSAYGLDLGAYFASRPIRPATPLCEDNSCSK